MGSEMCIRDRDEAEETAEAEKNETEEKAE